MCALSAAVYVLFTLFKMALARLAGAWGLWGVPIFFAVPVTVAVGGSLIGDRH
jgi:hypothetical protein